MTRHLIRVAIAGTAVLLASCGGATKPLPRQIEPSAPGFRYVGRFTEDYRSEWTGSTVEFRFDGRSANVVLESKRDVLFEVIVDGEPHGKIVTDPDRTLYPLVRRLPPGEHHVQLFRLGESFFGPVRFGGVQLPEDAQLLEPPPPSDRRMEVFGDSITAGYGNTAAGPEEGFERDTENGLLTYWALAARELGADAICIAWSGRGVYRNYGQPEPADHPMPALYGRTLGTDVTTQWDFNQWIPDVHIINLGTNDFSTGIPDEETFVTAYSNHVASVRSVYPDAHIICCVGPMISEESPEPGSLSALRHYVRRVVDESEDDRVHLLEFTPLSRPEDFGAEYHPSASAHRQMARELEASLQEILGWEPIR